MFYEELGKNYLNTCDSNAAIFTYGDMDTYPLIYAQEKLGYRTDVKVVNVSLANTFWYIDYLTRKANPDKRLKINLSPEFYASEHSVVVIGNADVDSLTYLEYINELGQWSYFDQNSRLTISSKKIVMDELEYKFDSYLLRSDIFIMDLVNSNDCSFYFAHSGGISGCKFNAVENAGLAKKLLSKYEVEHGKGSKNLSTYFLNDFQVRAFDLDILPLYADKLRYTMNYQDAVLKYLTNSFTEISINEIEDLTKRFFLRDGMKINRMYVSLIQLLAKDKKYLALKESIIVKIRTEARQYLKGEGAYCDDKFLYEESLGLFKLIIRQGLDTGFDYLPVINKLNSELEKCVID